MERVVFDDAVRRLNAPGHDVGHGTCKVLVVREVELSLEKTCLRNSHDIKLNLKLSNRGRGVKSMSIFVNAQVANYTATKVTNVLHDSYVQKLMAGQAVNIPILIPYSAYCKYAVTHDSMKVSVDATDENGDIYETDTDITLEDPPISIKVLGEARLHHPVTVQVEFKNPLNETLRFCSLTINGSGLFRSELFESIGDLPANTTLTHQIQTTPYRAGLKTVVADFDCSTFRDVKDSCTVYVKP